MHGLDKKNKITSKKISKFFFLKYPFAVCRRTFAAGFNQKCHIHDFPQVWYCHSGAHIHFIGGKTNKCKKGSLLIIPPGVEHSFTFPEKNGGVLTCLEMSSDIFLDAPVDTLINTLSNLFLPCFAKDLGYMPPQYSQLSILSQERFCEILAHLSAVSHSAVLDDQTSIFCGLEEMFSLPETKLPPKLCDIALEICKTKLLPILESISFVNKNFQQKIVAEDLLHISALCRTHFFRYFKMLTGTSFSAYLQELRLAYAFILIGNSDYPLSHIAELCGFSDAAYMTKCYKKYLSSSPLRQRPLVREDFDEMRIRRLERYNNQN